ncbi:hypothetical protein CLAFUW4_02967 [Fulvia fulva]|uniref:PH domain-containing protein n=1 Tax=Passalora fulva TaxID=5499 RepID=A0A9Q8LBS6_PASFU|nr:uncharacterized protein CLAFUR5_02953 [Fulvia fulva]KAK4631945.1 hypothetical protein CLAFUR4_02960 [Fulvia fulva]KAK4633571.1 hypothetical protein CLAFUR0_02963 [Fulvia fulva]UJO14570.1 hypothetical protein CLAFUR5_02953 [Fulvia fulva]WPV10607.1 hypothetical protein CLAFUW4_02967 [Fulvia fulva]WPV26536.1 hypothetical protein CLAFUW7_02964 [Fulvia fulva]
MPRPTLPADSHTAKRLEHATAQHLHETTRRVFIGPVPEGWLHSHRKQWYRQYVGNSAERQPTFTAAHPVSNVGHDTEAQPTNEGSGSLEPAEDALPTSPTLSAGGAALREPEPATSITSLLHSRRGSQRVSSVSEAPRPQPTDGPNDEQPTDSAPPLQPILNTSSRASRVARVASKLPVPKVRFTEASRLQLRARAQRLAAKGNFRSSKVKNGEMMKVDKMLIRIDITQQSLREDYDEKISQGVETKSLDKWREFMVVCRRHTEDDAEAVLQFYQTRVIAVKEGQSVKKKPKRQILLSSKTSKVNLYSALDKTLCVWMTNGMRTTIYYLRAQSTAAAVEWYTFLRGLLGHKRAQTLQINVPDLSVSLRLDDPFRTLEESQTLVDAAEGDEEALAKAVQEEKGAADAIVSRCLEMLKQSPAWDDVLKSWAQTDRIGLAWKRYDRLEWVFGAVEQRMYGTIGMQKTHDLELRPKDHYPLSMRQRDGEVLQEPTPVEGYLIRLTSQKGKEIKLKRMMYKRLYFTTQSQYLVFVQPAKSTPPPYKAPSREDNRTVPSAKEILDEMPLVYEVDPYPLEGDHVAWLGTEGLDGAEELEARDKGAAAEAERNVNMMLASDGFVNLCNVKHVRDFHRSATPVDEHLEDGSDVDFHEEGNSNRTEDGNTQEVDEDRVLELVLNNGLVIRLQAYNKATRNEWRSRLKLLVAYWTERKRADMALYKTTREQNLQQLGIDERAEAVVGQFAYKWEVNQSYASPKLYNMCGISECRTIHHSGVLFRKPRKHTTFNRCHVVLSHGHLLIYQDTLRKRSGKKLVHIHHERIASISLEGCYLYSGLLTEGDLLYQNQTFDSNAPGHHALPRIYLEDSWTSTDEDAMTTFVIWHAKSKSWFKSSQNVDDVRVAERSSLESDSKREKGKTKLTRVSQLGATGRSVVFKARSRAERDHWVLAIQVEIERLAAQNEEVRIVDDEKEN